VGRGGSASSHPKGFTILTTLQHTVLWIGCAGMGLGCLALTLQSRRAPRGERYHFVISILVCSIAFVAYYSMANGYGIISLASRHEFIARYVDWTLTTPLLIGGLLLVGLPALDDGSPRTRNGLIFGAVGADVLMILIGLCAGLSQNNPVKYGYYAISCIAFFVVLWTIWIPGRAAAASQGAAREALYTRLCSALTILWFIYPIIWLLGSEGAGVVGVSVELTVITVTDLLAKVGYGLLLCGGVLAEEQSRDVPAGRPAVQTGGVVAAEAV
jgi:bacteriorhodopsin